MWSINSADLLGSILLFGAFGWFTYHSVHTLATEAILMRPKEAVHHLDGTDL